MAKRGTIEEERPDLVKYLVNEEDKYLSCGSKKEIKVKCLECGEQRKTLVCDFSRYGVTCLNNKCVNYKYRRSRGSIEEEIRYIIDWLVNKEDKFLTCGSTKKIKVKCPLCGLEKEIRPDTISNDGLFCNNMFCDNAHEYNKRTYKYEKGEIIKHIKIVDIIPDKNKIKHYKCKCLKCNNISEISEYDIETYKSCSVCDGKKVIKGINDVATTNPEMIKYFLNITDTYKYTSNSHKKVKMKCPDCGFKKEMTIKNLNKQGFGCDICGDGVSYPEKFIINLLKQLNIEFKTQFKTRWSNRRLYDFYIPNLKCIIETHGEQHYRETNLGKSLKEEQKNDKLKQQLALKNGIKHYIVLDCRKSKLEWIKESVMSSNLPVLLNFKEYDIDWGECNLNGLKVQSRIKIICDLWNSEYNNHTTKTISEITGYSRSNVTKYLNLGNELGLCVYDAKQEYINGIKNNKQKLGKKVICDNKVFVSIRDCAKFYTTNYTSMSQYLNGKTPMSQKYIDLGLRYYNPEVDGDIEQYEQYIAS